MLSRGSLLLFRGFGIPVKLHWSFLLLFIFISYLGWKDGDDAVAISVSLLFVSVVFFCVVLHEFGHALAARYFNISTVDITILPIGGMARLKKMPKKPWQELIVAIAGPLVNLAICLLIGFYLLIFRGYNPFFIQDALFGSRVESLLGTTNFLIVLWQSNLLLAVFNMAPAFPMDGGRVLRAGLQTLMSRKNATFIAMCISILLSAYALSFAFEYREYILGALALFIAYQSRAEYSQVALEEVTEARTVSELVKLPEVVFSDLDTAGAAFDYLCRDGGRYITVFENGEIQAPMGYVSIKDLVEVIKRENGAFVKLLYVPMYPIARIDSESTINEAMMSMSENGADMGAVFNKNAQFEGLISGPQIEQYAETLMKLEQR